MEKNLSIEMRGLVGECKKIYTKKLCRYSVLSVLDKDDVADYLKMMRLLSRASDLCVDMFEKQERLMDKLDEVMNVYLKQNDVVEKFDWEK